MVLILGHHQVVSPRMQKKVQVKQQSANWVKKRV